MGSAVAEAGLRARGRARRSTRSSSVPNAMAPRDPWGVGMYRRYALIRQKRQCGGVWGGGHSGGWGVAGGGGRWGGPRRGRGVGGGFRPPPPHPPPARAWGAPPPAPRGWGV